MKPRPTPEDWQNVLECVEEATGFREKSDSRDSFNRIKDFIEGQKIHEMIVDHIEASGNLSFNGQCTVKASYKGLRRIGYSGFIVESMTIASNEWTDYRDIYEAMKNQSIINIRMEILP